MGWRFNASKKASHAFVIDGLLIGDLKRDIWLKTLIFISVRIWDGLGLMMLLFS